MRKKITQISKIFIDRLTMFSRFRGHIELFLLRHIEEFENQYLKKLEDDIKNEDISIIKARWKFPSEEAYFYGECFDLDKYLESIEDEKTRKKVESFYKGQALFQLEEEYELRKHYTVGNMKKFLNEYQFLSLYSDFENYLYRYLKFHISKYMGILSSKTVTIGEILEKNKNFDLI